MSGPLSSVKVGLVVLSLCAGVAACQVESARSQLWEGQSIRGQVVDPPIPKVDFTLPSTVMDSFAFREQTDDNLALLFFGYTNCPDVCPIHMSNIATVLRKMSPILAARVQVIFVTTDPDRDTLDRLRDWLGHFDRDFVGVRGPLDRVNQIQRSMRLGVAYTEELSDGSYGVAHAAQVIAFVGANPADIVYPFGTRQEDWAHDLPILLHALSLTNE